MSEIKAVLLVPKEGDPLGLLAEGPCGARAPQAWKYETRSLLHWHAGHPLPYNVAGGEVAAVGLVLAWEGEPVAEGLDRLWRAKWMGAGRIPRNPTMFQAEQWGRYATVQHGLGTLVLLDTNSQEVNNANSNQ